MTKTLQQIVDDIEGIALDASRRLPPHILAEVLAFLTKVSHVLEQVYRDVIPILINIKYLDAHALSGAGLMEISKKIDLVVSTSHYRDAEEICSRLNTLKNTYVTELAQYISPDDQRSWSGLFGLIEEREGRIVQLIGDQLRDIQLALERATVDDLPTIRRLASDQITQVREGLEELNRFTSGFLGLSGTAGLLETLRNPDAGPAVTDMLSIMIDNRRVMGNQHIYSTTGSQSPIIGQGAQASDITITVNRSDRPRSTSGRPCTATTRDESMCHGRSRRGCSPQ